MKQSIDMSVVQELLDLCDDGDMSLIHDLVGMFLEDGPGKLQQVTDGLASSDLEAVERAAHSLKGSSGNLGATDLMNVAEELQNASRAGDQETSNRLGPALAVEYQSAATELGEFLQRLG